MKTRVLFVFFLFAGSLFWGASCKSAKTTLFGDKSYICPVHHTIVGEDGNGCGKCGKALVPEYVAKKYTPGNKLK